MMILSINIEYVPSLICIVESVISETVIGIFIIFPTLPLKVELVSEYIKTLYFLPESNDCETLKPEDLSEIKSVLSTFKLNLGNTVIFPVIDLWFPHI